MGKNKNGNNIATRGERKGTEMKRLALADHPKALYFKWLRIRNMCGIYPYRLYNMNSSL